MGGLLDWCPMFTQLLYLSNKDTQYLSSDQLQEVDPDLGRAMAPALC